MSAKRTNNSIKQQKVEQVDACNAFTATKVNGLINAHGISNINTFANISHKNSTGTNNWSKFTEILQQKKNPQTPRKTFNRQSQLQIASISENKINFQSKFPNNIRSSLGQAENKQDSQINKYINFKTPVESKSGINVSDLALKKNVNSTESRSEISKPMLTKHISMDCEMVGVEIGVNKNMLARISLVNSHGDCIYDKYVKPTEPVLDYRTRVSGIRPKDLENATDFKIVQKEVADMMKGRILIGHALKNDFKVLHLSHPKHSIRDTSRFRKFREGKTPALKKLAKKYLGVSIQEGEHSSVQDALAAMQLYKMFKKEWESSIFSKKYQAKKGEKSKPSRQPTPTQSVEVI